LGSCGVERVAPAGGAQVPQIQQRGAGQQNQQSWTNPTRVRIVPSNEAMSTACCRWRRRCGGGIVRGGRVNRQRCGRHVAHVVGPHCVSFVGGL
jgi:hypothetical protein